ILQRQNADGGFGTYERRRGSPRLERLNPSEMFGRCVIERSYVECTGSALAALARFRATYAEPFQPQIERALAQSLRFLRVAQRPEGGWSAAWGINFTYAVLHAVRGLRAAGVGVDAPTLARAAAWLTQTQRPDGGVGEHHTGCREERYVEHPESQVVMTAW